MSEKRELDPAYSPLAVHLEPQDTAVLRGHVTPAEIPGFLGHAFTAAAQDAASGGRTMTGPPFGRFIPSGDGFEVEAGCPIDAPLTPVGEALPGTLPGGRAVSVVHAGDYEAVGAAYAVAEEWAGRHGYEVDGVPWESYLDMPDVERPRTVVYLPCSGTEA